MTDWTDFLKAPVKAAKQLHVSKSDVARGERLNAYDRLIAEWPKSGEPYGLSPREIPPEVENPYPRINAQLRDKRIRDAQHKYGESAPPVTGDLSSSLAVLKHAFMRDEEAKNIAKGLALTAGIAGSVAAPALIPSTPMLSAAAINAITGVLPNLAFGNPEGIGQDALAGALLGKLTAAGHPGLGALSMLGSYIATDIPEAEAMPFTGKFLPRFKNPRGDVGHIPLYINPTSAEIANMWKTARELAREQGSDPVIRLMRDRRSPSDVYGWDGTDTLHKEAADALERPLHEFTGMTIEPRDDIYKQLEYLRGLKQDTEPPLRFAGGGAIKRFGKAAMSAMSPEGTFTTAPLGALSVVKSKGGNWLAGSVEDALRGLKKLEEPRYTHINENGFSVAPEYGRPMTPEELAVAQSRVNPMAAPLNQWIEGPLTKYIKTRMASPDDEVRKLAEQGVLHVEPSTLRTRYGNLEAWEPRTTLASSDSAKYWENASDSQIRKEFNPHFSEQPLYAMARTSPTSNLGLPHLIDELTNAMNPSSGLPQHLLLSPDAVKNMSMEKAVRRVADINDWRAAQQAAANAELANKASLVRDYPHTPETPNPKGLRWVELNAKTPLPTGHEIKTDMTGTRVYGPRGEDLSRSSHPSAEDALVTFNRDSLEKQLKYEGDIMGHCVGGYCDDVLSGQSRIFSLRDAKGEPHVTVEVKPSFMNQSDAVKQAKAEGLKGYDFASRVSDLMDGKDLPPAIHQIKGKQNRAPNEEYLPFVQDFVRNPPHGGQWSDVGDLQNTGLYKLPDNRYITKDQLGQALQKIDPEGLVAKDPQWLINQINRDKGWWENAKGAFEGFAHGGPVGNSHNNDFHDIIAALEQELAHAAG